MHPCVAMLFLASVVGAVGSGGGKSLADKMARACIDDRECRAKYGVSQDDAEPRSLFEGVLRSHGLSDETCGGLVADDYLRLAMDMRYGCCDCREIADNRASGYMTIVMASVIVLALTGFGFLFVVADARVRHAGAPGPLSKQ